MDIDYGDCVQWRTRCLDCGANYSQYGSGKEYMLTRIEATCDKCGSHNVDRHFMRMISKDAFG